MDIHFSRRRFDFNLRWPLEETWMDETNTDSYLFNKWSEREEWQTHAYYMLSKDGKHWNEHVCSMQHLIPTLKSHLKDGLSISLLQHSLSKKQAYDLKAQWQEQLMWWGVYSSLAMTDRERGIEFKK